MRLYRADYNDPDHGYMVEWVGSRRAATVARADIRARYDRPPEVTIQPVEVPTDKAALLRWLNDNLGTDNG